MVDPKNFIEPQPGFDGRIKQPLGQITSILRNIIGVTLIAGITQLISALSGLIIVWWLPINDYATYTIFMTVTAAIVVLSRSGAHLEFTSIVGTNWPRTERISSAIISVKRMRTVLSVVFLPPALAFTAYLMVLNRSDYWTIFLVIASVLCVWYSDNASKVIDQVLYFAKYATKVQVLDGALATARLGLIGLLIGASALNAATAVVATGIMALPRIPIIERWVRAIIPHSAKRFRDDELRIQKTTIRQIPSELLYVFQGQLVILLIARFGHFSVVAGFGALQRIPQILYPIQTLVVIYLIPAFVKRRESLTFTLILYVALASTPYLCLLILSYWAPWSLLSLIGPHYSMLSSELLTLCALLVLTNAAATTWSLVAHRGWNRWAWLQIPISAIWIGIAVSYLDLGTIRGALELQAGFSLGLFVSALADLNCGLSAARSSFILKRRKKLHDN